MKIKLFFLLYLPAVLKLVARNPIVPEGVYITNPLATVWNDGKLYICHGTVRLHQLMYPGTVNTNGR